MNQLNVANSPEGMFTQVRGGEFNDSMRESIRHANFRQNENQLINDASLTCVVCM